MKTAISGVYHHMIKDEKMTLVQQHKHCPMNKSTWCKFWQDKLHNHGNYTEDSQIPEVFKSRVCLLTSKLPHQSWYKIEVYPIPYVNRTVEKNNSKETYDWVAMK